MSELLERFRMCLAEAGHDPELLIDAGDGVWEYPAGAYPTEVMWRAREVVGRGDPLCFACYMECYRRAQRGDEFSVPDCIAPTRLAEDCGVSRV